MIVAFFRNPNCSLLRPSTFPLPLPFPDEVEWGLKYVIRNSNSQRNHTTTSRNRTQRVTQEAGFFGGSTTTVKILLVQAYPYA